MSSLHRLPRPALLRHALQAALGVAVLLLGACASKPSPSVGAGSASGATSGQRPIGPNNTATSAVTRPHTGTSAGAARAGATPDVRTRNALFRQASFDELPGWQQDDLRASWGAFRNSCEVLQRRETWREICASSKTVAPSNPEAIRSFYEARFAVLRIINTDNTREGDVTGYFEPLLEGQRERSSEFDVPVLGTPTDLYTIDWSRVPEAQRKGIVRVVPNGPLLVPVTGSPPGSYAMDLRRFTLDDRDRRLRVRLVGDGPTARVEPYHTRAELDALGLPQGIKAPVIAWVNDSLALYAMQVQGSGRIRLADGTVLRVQYAEQNGHPFKPLRVAARPQTTVVTRGAAPAREAADEFVLEGEAEAAPAPHDEEVITRGGMARPRPAQAGGKPDPLVDALLANQRPSAKPASRASRAASPKTSVNNRLISDPSYVFFKTVADRPATEGPQGALGVALTPGRSVAVDPRVTPLGYPMFLNAPPVVGSSIEMQRLVFAQDTGGAIRGALRADYFWGFGNEAGQKARSTRHRGQMWVMMPLAEAARLGNSRIVTRGAAAVEQGEASCLIDDGEFCTEVD